MDKDIQDHFEHHDEHYKHQEHTCKQLELQTKITQSFTIMEKTPTRAFSQLKVPTSTFTFIYQESIKTLS